MVVSFCHIGLRINLRINGVDIEDPKIVHLRNPEDSHKLLEELGKYEDDPLVTVDGERVPARAHLGRLTQPLSFIGLPVIAVPLLRPGQLPLGLQLVGAPGREGRLFALAERLEAEGVIGFSPPG